MREAHEPRRVPSPLYVMRYGETEWNVERMQGCDSPLTAFGRRQAAALGELLAVERADALPIYSSPSEVDIGPFSGRYLAELAAEHPGLFRDVYPPTWHFRVPGGETIDMVRARAADFLDSLL